MTVTGAGDTPSRPRPSQPAHPAGDPPEAPTLFDLPETERDPGAGPSGAVGILRQLDVDRLVAVERAAALVSRPVANLWYELASSAETAVSPQSLDSLLRASLRAMSQLLGVDTVAVLLANEQGDELVARAAIGLSEELTLGLGIRTGEGMAGRVLASRRPLLVGDLSAIDVVSPVLRDSGLRSVAAVPLLGHGDRPLGVLYAASHELDQFSRADADLLEMLGGRLAAALERVRLFEAERTARQEAERLAGQIRRMQEVTALLAAVTTTGQAAQALAETLVEATTGADPWWAAVWFLEDWSLVPAAHATRGARLPSPSAIDLADDRAPARAVRSRRAIYLGEPDAARAGDPAALPAEPRRRASVAEPPFEGGAFAALPIPSPDGCLGVVGLAYSQPRSFGPEERAFLEAVVHQASVAFDRARLAAEQERATSRATFFAGAARSLADADDLTETLDRLADLAIEALGEICLVDLVDEEGNGVRRVAKHRDPARQPLVDRLRDEYPPDPGGVHPAAEVLRSGTTRWSDHMSEAFLRVTTRDAGHLALTNELGFRSYATVPIVGSREVLGTLTTVSCSRPLRPDDVSLAEQLARQVAGLVDSARRFDAAARTSRVLQASLLPRDLPSVPGLSVDTRYLPGTRALEVGGDFYDVYRLPSGTLGFAIGDVAGHDRTAAAMMGHLRTAGRALAAQSGSPGGLVDALRASWELLGFDRIATAVFGQLHPATGELALAAAGHYPPLHKQEHEATYLPVTPGPPLGVPGGAATQWEGVLEPTAVLLLYTDGAIDERLAGSETSMALLADLVAAAPSDPAAICERTVGSLPEDRADDVALLAIRLTATHWTTASSPAGA